MGNLKIWIKEEEHTCVQTSSQNQKEKTKAYTTGQVLSGTTYQYGYFEIKAKSRKAMAFGQAIGFSRFITIIIIRK